MTELKVKRLYVLSDIAPPNDPYDSAIASLVANGVTPNTGGAATSATGVTSATAGTAPTGASGVAGSSLTLVGQQQIDTATNTQPVGYAQIVAAVAATDPDAVLVGAAPDPGVEALWQELHAALPAAKLFAPSTLATGSFRSTLGAAAGSTYVTSPFLELGQYPRSAQRVLSAYRQRFGIAPTAYSLYGFEAMSSVLAAIRRAGVHGANRLDVISAYFHLGERHSVIGSYAIDANGDSSLSRFAGYRVAPGGALVELRLLSVSVSASSSSG
jgi:branched-chain amino acid transport system substrate-binding protein